MSGKGATSTTVPSNNWSGKASTRILAFMPSRDLVDLRLVHLGVHLLRAVEVDHAEYLLPFANRRTFLDLRTRRPGCDAARGIGVDHHAVSGALIVHAAICLSSFRALPFSSCQLACLASSSRPLPLDVKCQRLDRLVSGVLLENLLLGLCQLECRLLARDGLFARVDSVFDVELGHDV